MVNQLSDKDSCPEEHRGEGSRQLFAKVPTTATKFRPSRSMAKQPRPFAAQATGIVRPCPPDGSASSTAAALWSAPPRIAPRRRGRQTHLHARAFSPGFQCREIHVRRQILLARRRIIILAHAMLSVSKQRPAHVMIVEKIRRRMPIINRQHVTALQPPPDFRDPVASFQPCFGVLSVAQSNILRRKILSDR